MVEDIKKAADDFLGQRDALIEKAANTYPFPGPEDKRRITAFGVEYDILYVPWRGKRREKGDIPPPFIKDRAYEIIKNEEIWRYNKYVITPNKYPFSKRQILLWEDNRLREPSANLISLSYLIVAKLKGYTGLMNTTGSAATIPKAHMQIANIERRPAVAEFPMKWKHYNDFKIGFPAEESKFQVFYICFSGDAIAIGKIVENILIQRRCTSFNIIIFEDLLYLFPRLKETKKEAYPYPLGALELAGCFAFEHKEPFLNTTSKKIEQAITESCYPNKEKYKYNLLEIIVENK